MRMGSPLKGLAFDPTTLCGTIADTTVNLLRQNEYPKNIVSLVVNFLILISRIFSKTCRIQQKISQYTIFNSLNTSSFNRCLFSKLIFSGDKDLNMIACHNIYFGAIPRVLTCSWVPPEPNLSFPNISYLLAVSSYSSDAGYVDTPHKPIMVNLCPHLLAYPYH